MIEPKSHRMLIRMDASIVEEKREAHQLLERRKYRGQRRNS